MNSKKLDLKTTKNKQAEVKKIIDLERYSKDYDALERGGNTMYKPSNNHKGDKK